jgi:flagellar hook assembly protein FlgD
MKVRTLAGNQGSTGDKGNFYWDGSDQNGNDLPAGVYFIRMTMDGKEVETVKVVKE